MTDTVGGRPAGAGTAGQEAARPAAGSAAFRVLATCGVFEPGFRGGGPVRSVAGIIDTLPADIEVDLVTRDRDVGASLAYPGLSGHRIRRGQAWVHYLDTGSPAQWWRLWRGLRTTRYDLLYVNSLLSPWFTLVPVLAARCGLLRVAGILVAPRGELSPGALALKAVKKRAFLFWWGWFLRRARVRWHACSDREAGEIRAACPWAEVLVSPNRTALDAEPMAPRDTGPGPARLVFVSRITPKKNLMLVLEAVALLRHPVRLDIFGPVQDHAYWDRCQTLIRRLPAHVRVSYRGELPPAQVLRTLAGYDAFVFPTLGENFGHVIAESLAASCPVVCSDRTPWTSLLADGGGQVVTDLTPAGLAAALVPVVSADAGQRLCARRAAGAAYRSWRAQGDGPNILVSARQSIIGASASRTCTPVRGPAAPSMGATQAMDEGSGRVRRQ